MALKITIMPAIIRFGASDLLQYNPKYSLLICRECQYAIQKKRADSHPLRYKIYRGDIQRLLSSIAQKVDPLEPHLVPLPAPLSPPVHALPSNSLRLPLHSRRTLILYYQVQTHEKPLDRESWSWCVCSSFRAPSPVRGKVVDSPPRH